MNVNTQFVFNSRLRTTLLIGMGIGVLCLALTFLSDDEYHTRFWTSWLQNSLYFTGIAFMSFFFLCAQITAFAGWNITVKRVWEAMGQFLWVGLILLAVIVIGVWGHFHHLYHWNTPGITDPANAVYDKIIAGKSGFLNRTTFSIGVLGILALWYFWARSHRQVSVSQDTRETEALTYYRKERRWAASFLPLGGFLSPVFLWLMLMSIDPHWYSTMFAWYSTVSLWLGSLSLTIMLILYLKSRGYLEFVTGDHLHDIGKYLFGITVFWTYLWFDQFMLIWYANIGEETIYFKERMAHYPVLFWGNLAMNFVVPFLILMRNDTKRKFGTLFFVSAIVFFGHWWDFFYMIKPGARIAAFEAKELAEGVHGHKSGAVQGSEVHDISHEQGSATHSGETAMDPKLAQDGDSENEKTIGNEGSPTEAGQGGTAEQPGVNIHREGMTADRSQQQGVGDTAAAAQTESALTPGQEGQPSQNLPEAAGPADAGSATHHGGADKSFKMGYTIPGLEDIGVMIGFLSLFLFFFFRQLASASLLPLRDPYLEESLHHTTGVYLDDEEGAPAHH